VNICIQLYKYRRLRLSIFHWNCVIVFDCFRSIFHAIFTFVFVLLHSEVSKVMRNKIFMFSLSDLKCNMFG